MKNQKTTASGCKDICDLGLQRYMWFIQLWQILLFFKLLSEYFQFLIQIVLEIHKKNRYCQLAYKICLKNMVYIYLNLIRKTQIIFQFMWSLKHYWEHHILKVLVFSDHIINILFGMFHVLDKSGKLQTFRSAHN